MGAQDVPCDEPADHQVVRLRARVRGPQAHQAGYIDHEHFDYGVVALVRYGDALVGRAGGALGDHGRPGREPGALNPERAGRRALGSCPGT